MRLGMRRLTTGLIAVVAVMIAAGCASSAPDTDGSPTDTNASDAAPTPADSGAPNDDASDDAAAQSEGDPCRLLTPAEAEAALGKPVLEPQTTVLPTSPETGNGFDCAYNAASSQTAASSVHVGLLGDSVPRDAWEDAARSQEGLEEVSGLGELAFFDPSNDSLDVFDQGRWIQVQMIDSERYSELVAILTELARNALARV